MRLYKIWMIGDFGDTDTAQRWTATKADIARIKREMKADCHNASSWPEPGVEIVDFKPSKAGILEMLTKHANK